jgi:RNA polymerase sigma-70 factor (ECF subfamily)
VHEERDPVGPADGALVTDLLLALADGDVDRMVRLLHPDVVLLTDSGPDVRAARLPVVGAERTARFLVKVTARNPVEELEVLPVNGVWSLRFTMPDRTGVMQIEAEGGLVRAITMVSNPDKLRHLNDTVPLV